MQVVAHGKAHQHNDMPTIPNAKYPTGIVIDLKRSQGNVFYLMGLTNRLARELGLFPKEITEFKREQASATTYHAHLNLLRKWFGIVFAGSDND